MSEHVAAAPEVPQYREEPLRWAALLQLFVMNAGNTSSWVAYSIVYHEAMAFFGMSKFQANFLSMTYALVYLVGAIPIINFFNSRGLNFNAKLASVCNMSGNVLKLIAVFALPSFWVIWPAQIVLATTTLICYVAPPVMSSTWFNSEHQTFATTVCTMANYVGLALGTLLPPLFVTPGGNGPSNWGGLFGLQLGIAVCDALLLWLVVPPLPVEPPSAFAALHRTRKGHQVGLIAPEDDAPAAAVETAPPMSVKDTIIALGRDRNFLMLCLGGGLLVGLGWGISGLITQLLFPFNFSARASGTIGFTAIVTGVGLAFPVAYVMDRTHRYKHALLACAALFSIAGLAIVIQLALNAPTVDQQADRFATVFGFYVISGMAQACSLATLIEFSVELAFPIDPAYASGLTMWAANFVQVMMLLIVPAVMGVNATPKSALAGFGIFVGVGMVAFVLLCFVRVQLNRREYEASSTATPSMAPTPRPAAETSYGTML